MTTLLAKAFDQAQTLPAIEQNALAKWLLDELESEKKWSEAFAESEDVLEKLADEAQYVARHAPQRVTEAMDRVCDEVGRQTDEFAAAAARRILERSE